MMDAFKLGRIYKGEEYTISLPLPFSGSVDNFQLYFFTDSASTVDVPYSSLSISGNVADIEFSDTDLDVLHDGVLCYYLKYSIGTVDYIQSTNTMHYLKTPDGYSGRTAEDIYEEGYNDGVEAAGGDYTDGYNDGIDYQKSKLTSIEITDNGDYTNADGYSAVTVNVPQTGGTFVGETKNYNLTSNGTTTITPDAGYDGITGGTITVDVPQTGGTFVTQTKNYNITANGNTNITPDAGYDGITGGTISVNVPTINLEPYKDELVYTTSNGRSSLHWIWPSSGYNGMRMVNLYIHQYSQSPFNKFSFTIYFDETENYYYMPTLTDSYGTMEGYNIEDILEYQIDGVDISPSSYVRFEKNTSHTIYFVGPNITKMFEMFKEVWILGGYRIVWDSWTAYNSVTPALYVTGIPMTYTSTTVTLLPGLVNGDMHFENVTKLVLSGECCDMLFLSKGSINYPNCNEIRICDGARYYPNVLNYNNGDKFNLASSGTVFVPNDNYLIDIRIYEEDGKCKFLSLLPSGWTVEVPQPDPNLLRFTAQEVGSTVGYTSTLSTQPVIYKSTDGFNFESWDGTPVTLSNAGDTLWVYGTNQRLATSASRFTKFTMSGEIEAYGDVTYLLQSGGTTTLSDNYALYGLFKGCTSLTTAPTLPATTLTDYCYQQMFYGCNSLIIAPSLPATTLASYCYKEMFCNCTSLTTAPALTATVLATGCYQNMFQTCTELTTVPEILPATTLSNMCYSSMFVGCSSLRAAPVLPATTLTQYCYTNMFCRCSSLTTAPELPATTLVNDCYSNMFYGCTSLTTAPELPATTLAAYCYENMFYSCTSLNNIVCLATNISALNCTKNWVTGVAATGTFVKDPNMNSWTTGNNGIPDGWTVVNN